MPWTDTSSQHFEAHHEAEETADALAVLRMLEDTRTNLVELFPEVPDKIAVILHSSGPLLALAHPQLLIARQVTAPAARRYLTGWYTGREVHVLSLRALRARAAGPDSAKALELAPSCEYTRLVVGLNNPSLPPPYSPASTLRLWRWAWLIGGAAQYFSGQAQLLSAAIRLRLREGTPDFPLGQRDTTLLGGTIFSLLDRERGREACVQLCRQPTTKHPNKALIDAFNLPLRELEMRWKQHLATISQPKR